MLHYFLFSVTSHTHKELGPLWPLHNTLHNPGTGLSAENKGLQNAMLHTFWGIHQDCFTPKHAHLNIYSMHVSQWNIVWDTPTLQFVSQKGAMLVPLTHVEVGLYYKKSHTLKHPANARFATISSISLLLKVHKKKRDRKYPQGNGH
jgi:hypothetical protein